MARKKKIDSDKPKKVVSKRKVGRPKKRGRKKKYYTPKKKTKKVSKKVATKGFSKNVTYNRVRSILWSNFKDDFPNYRALISNQIDEDGNKIKGSSIVSQVFSQCKDLDCLDSDIIEIYNQFKNQTPDFENRPILPNDYFDLHYYWELETEDWWSGFDSRVWVVAPMLIQDPDSFLGILGSDRYVDANGELINRRFDAGRGDYIIYGKSQRFKEFINHCNSLQREGLIGGSNDVPNWRFAGETDDEDDTDVFWNPFTRRWEIRIIICTPQGDVEDYDFTPNEPDRDIDDERILDIVNRTPAEEVPEEPANEPPTTTRLSKEEIDIRNRELSIRERELKLEEDKNERINKLTDKFLDGQIDADTFAKLLDRLNK